MNSFEIKKLTVNNGYETEVILIDGKPLYEYIEEWVKDDKKLYESLAPIDYLDICWTYDYDFEGDARFMRFVLSKDTAITPILSCPDDFDFSCIVIVADVLKTEDTVFWRRIGKVDQSKASFEEEKRSGILFTKAYTKEDYEKYGDNIALETVDSPAWCKWIGENWSEELYRRRINYTYPFIQDERNIIWFANCNFEFKRDEYDKAVNECYYDSFDAFEEIHTFYENENPTDAERFRFVESMKYMIEISSSEEDISALSYNLAVYYHRIREFQSEKQYLEIGAALDDSPSEEGLGRLWYYGLCGEIDYEKAYLYFSKAKTLRSQYMIADMYHYGQYVRQDVFKARQILEDLFLLAEDDINGPYFNIYSLYPEIALRLIRLNLEEERYTKNDLRILLSARNILANRQKKIPSWENLKTMKSIIETIDELAGEIITFTDLYDLLAFDVQEATITFDYKGDKEQLYIFPYGKEVIYQLNGTRFHGAEDFLERSRIGDFKIINHLDQISNIQQTGRIQNYEYQYIALTCVDGEIFIGDVLMIDYPDDNDEGCWGLALELNDGNILFFRESEIWRIKNLGHDKFLLGIVSKDYIQYSGMNVTITTTSGKRFTGYVQYVCDMEETEEGEQVICLLRKEIPHEIGILASKITTIIPEKDTTT